RQPDDAALDAHALLAFLVARGRRRGLLPMQAILHPLRALLDDRGHELHRIADRLEDQRLLLGRGALEHVVDDLAPPALGRAVARMPHAEAQPPEVRPRALDHAADAVVSGGTAVELQL